MQIKIKEWFNRVFTYEVKANILQYILTLLFLIIVFLAGRLMVLGAIDLYRIADAKIEEKAVIAQEEKDVHPGYYNTGNKVFPAVRSKEYFECVAVPQGDALLVTCYDNRNGNSTEFITNYFGESFAKETSNE